MKNNLLKRDQTLYFHDLKYNLFKVNLTNIIFDEQFLHRKQN